MLDHDTKPTKIKSLHEFFDEYFFREILIVSVGLVIALGLQGFVGEYRSWRLLHDTRTGLQQEVDANIRILRHDDESCVRLQSQLEALANAIDLRRAGGPTPYLNLDFDYHPAFDLVWKTAQDDRAVELMPLREQRRDAERYRLSMQLNANWDRVLPSLYEIQAILLKGSTEHRGTYTLESLSSSELDQLSLSIARARIAIGIFRKNLVSNIRFYDYGERIARAEE